MTDRTVRVRLEATVDGFNAAMDSARAKAKGLSGDVEKSSKSQTAAFQGVGTAVGIAGAAVVTGLGLAANASMGFEKQLSQLRAATGANAQTMDQLRTAAITTGRDTMFSASQAADAETALAKAGVSVSDILGGALTGAVSLAAAGQLELGDAAEIAASAMSQFNLKGSQVGHVADLLAAGAGKAQGSVKDMAMALGQSGIVASQTGLTIEETTGALAAFAQNGLLGSDAGTSFKTMLQRLNPQSQQAADLMKQLGLSAYDQQGKFVGLANYAGRLQSALAGMTDQQKNATLQVLFGQDAIRAASVLYKDGAAGIQSWIDKVNDSGYAAKYAATANDNLSGDLMQLKGSIETALINTGSQANGVLRAMAQAATGAVNAYAGMPGPMQAVATGGAALAAAVLLGGGAFVTAVPKIEAYKAALATAGPRTQMVAGAMGALGKSVAIAGLVVGTALAIDQLNNAMAKAPTGAGAMSNALADFLRTGSLTGDAAKRLGSSFQDLGNTIDRANKSKYLAFDVGGPSGIQAARTEIQALDAALTQMVQAGHGTQAAAIFADMQRAAEASGTGLDAVNGAFKNYRDAVSGAAAESKLATGDTGALAAQQQQLAASTAAATDAFKNQGDALKASYDPVFAMNQALVEEKKAQDDAATAVREHGAKSKEAQQAQIDLLQATVGLNGAALTLTGSVNAGTTSVQGMTAQLGGWVRAGLITQAQANGLAGQISALTGQAARLDGVDPQVTIGTNAPAAAAAVDGIDRKLRALDGRSATVTVNILQVGAGKLSPAVLGKADGGVVSYYASGGMAESHVAQIAPAGSYRVWAEQETGGEAYIPLASAKRGRSTSVWAETGRRLGVLSDAPAAQPAAVGVGDFAGDLYLDSGEFLGKVRGEVRSELASTARRVSHGRR